MLDQLLNSFKENNCPHVTLQFGMITNMDRINASAILLVIRQVKSGQQSYPV